MATQNLFATVPEKKLLPFYSSEGSFEPKKVVSYFSFTLPEVAVIAGVSPNSVRYDGERTSEPVRRRLSEIANICELVANQFDGDQDKTFWWFTTENPLLGDISPRQMIKFGNYERLRKIIQDFIAGNVA